MVAPSTFRVRLRGCPLRTQLPRIGQLTSPPGAVVEPRVTVLTLHSLAAGIRFLLT